MAEKRQSLHFCGWMLRKRVCPEATRKNLAVERDEDKERERERREKKDGARMGKRILFLVGGSSECLSSSLPLSLSLLYTFFLPLFHSFPHLPCLPCSPPPPPIEGTSDTCNRLIL